MVDSEPNNIFHTNNLAYLYVRGIIPFSHNLEDYKLFEITHLKTLWEN